MYINMYGCDMYGYYENGDRLLASECEAPAARGWWAITASFLLRRALVPLRLRG